MIAKEIDVELSDWAVKRLRDLHEGNRLTSRKDIAKGAADSVLCELLEKLGYVDVVEEWNRVDTITRAVVLGY